jgi:hypothetical protein
MAANDIKALKELASGGFREITLTPADIGAVASDDSRLTDARTPTAHASNHLPGGSDAVAYVTGAATLYDSDDLNAANSRISHAVTGGWTVHDGDGFRSAIGAAANPMTTAGDLFVGGTSGAPARLALGTAAQQLRVNSGATGLEYFTPAAAFDPASPGAIGGTTPAAGSFTTLSAAPAANTTALTSTGYSLTGSNAQSLIDLSGTWNTTGVPIALKTDLTVTAAGSNARYADFQAGGYSQFSAARISGTSNALWLYNVNSGTNTNGVGTNYERAALRWNSNILELTNEAAGTGSLRAIYIGQTDTSITTVIGRRTSYDGNGVGLFCAPVVNQCSIGAFLHSVRASSSSVVIYAQNSAASGSIPHMRFDSGLIRLFTDATNSTAHPAFKNSGSTLQVRIANDSGFAPVECAGLTLNGNLTASTRDIVTDTTTGTKIGTATTQKIGFFNATPVVQQAAVADATDAASTQDRLNDLLARLRTLGLIAT